MKRALFIALFLITAGAIAQTVVGTGQIIPISSATGTPTRWTNATTLVRKVTILGKKSSRTANTGDVYIGPTSGNDTQAFKVAADGEAVMEAPPGTFINLSDWYVDVTTANDGVVIIYQ